MSKVKELLEREEKLKNWTLDEMYELQVEVSDEIWERTKERELTRLVKIANSYEMFEMMCKSLSDRITREEIMGIWIDFIEGKDNSK